MSWSSTPSCQHTLPFSYAAECYKKCKIAFPEFLFTPRRSSSCAGVTYSPLHRASAPFALYLSRKRPSARTCIIFSTFFPRRLSVPFYVVDETRDDSSQHKRFIRLPALACQTAEHRTKRTRGTLATTTSAYFHALPLPLHFACSS